MPQIIAGIGVLLLARFFVYAIGEDAKVQRRIKREELRKQKVVDLVEWKRL